MALFAVLADKPNTELQARIQKEFRDDFYALADTQWLISADLISRDVAERLDIRGGSYGRAVVVSLAGGYSGHHAKTLWEWLRLKSEASL